MPTDDVAVADLWAAITDARIMILRALEMVDPRPDESGFSLSTYRLAMANELFEAAAILEDLRRKAIQ